MDASYTDQITILGQLVIAMLLGAIIGIERELHEKPAGLRTHMFVAGASCLFILIGPLLVQFYSERTTSPEILKADPIHNIQAIVLGIAFLGAGTIIHGKGEHVSGLTTSASLLLSSAIGIYVALNQMIIAVGIALITFTVLRAIGYVEDHFLKQKSARGE